MHTYFVALAAVVLVTPCIGINNGLGLLPPMGWRSWNQFGGSVTQALMSEVVTGMAARIYSVNGNTVSLRDLGYSDVGIDDGWQLCHAGVNGGYHTAAGNPIVDTSKFPDLRNFTDNAHNNNLTAGWYGNNCICSDPSNNVSHFTGDVASFRAFNFDSYKLDSCGGEQDIQLWSNLLASSGRAVMIENCHNGPWNPEPPRKPDSPAWCPFNIWRSSTDIWADYAVAFGINLQTALSASASSLSFPGCWAYPDMLQVGVTPGLHPGETGLTYTEARTHFNAWAIVSSPLVLSLDVRNVSLVNVFLPIIGNTEAISINQQWANATGGLLSEANTTVTFTPCGFWPNCTIPVWQILYKPLENKSAALLVLNHAVPAGIMNLSIQWSQVPTLQCGSKGCMVRDVNAHADIGVFIDGYTFPNVTLHEGTFITATPVA
jgi:alpha-galactosidase